MKRTFALLGLVLATIPLSACAGDGYSSGGLTWSSHPYYRWYDNYYGPFYDGYWGSDNFFYFRLNERERSFRRDHNRHFRMDDRQPGDGFRRFEGTTQQPPRGTRMPRFPQDGQRTPRRGD